MLNLSNPKGDAGKIKPIISPPVSARGFEPITLLWYHLLDQVLITKLKTMTISKGVTLFF